MGRRQPGLPIKLHPWSNGEYSPAPAGAVAHEAIRRAQEACDTNARRVGLSRRAFLRSTMGAATTLAVLAACSSESGDDGGTFRLPDDAGTDEEVASDALNGNGFVMDVQGHLLEHDLSTPLPAQWFGSGFPQARCADEDDPRGCFSLGHFLDEVLIASDTSVVVLSAVPDDDPNGPLRPSVMDEARRRANELCGSGRLLIQGHVAPTAGQPLLSLDAMGDIAERWQVDAWKVYTHAGPGWFLDDHVGNRPQVGDRLLTNAVELGVPIVAVHKGLSGGSPFASPVDVGPAAARHPGASIVVYHSGFEGEVREGPFVDSPLQQGIDRLIASVRRAGLGPGSNVYAELGSTWRTLMARPDEAAHALGKLLVHIGADNILWGTDSIWYGSPQDQIQAFRAFEISEEFQERYGYPPLTTEVKAKVLGLNAARLYDVEPVAQRCVLNTDERAELRLARSGTNHTFG